MKLTYLGTAAAEGFPGLFCACDTCREATRRGSKDLRTRSQAIVDDVLLIDLPPDTYLHMLRNKINLPDIEHMLITHTHSDHFQPGELYYRRPGFCDTRSLMTVYGNDELKRRMDEMVEETQTTYEKSKLVCVELTEFVPQDIAGYTVVPLLARHARNEKCFIYLIGKNDKWLLYGNDTGIFPEATWQYIRGKKLDLVSLDCTCGQMGEGTNHMGVPDLIKMRQLLADAGCLHAGTQLIANHFSHNGGLLHEGLEQQLQPHGYQVSYDGMTVTV